MYTIYCLYRIFVLVIIIVTNPRHILIEYYIIKLLKVNIYKKKHPIIINMLLANILKPFILLQQL